MRSRVLLLLVAVAAVATAIVLLARPESPVSARDRIVAAALAQKSVHWTEVSINVLGGMHWSSDVNTESGDQWGAPQVPVADGNVHELLVNSTFYIHGNSAGIQDQLHVSKAQARKYAGEWISIPKGDPVYAENASGLTLASIVRGVTPHGELRLLGKDSNGNRRLVVQSKGGVWTQRSLSAPPSGLPLPVNFYEGPDLGPDALYTFSKWNESVHVQAPAHAIPIAVVRGG